MLIADDERTLRSALVDTFSKEHDVVSADCGYRTMRKLSCTEFSLVILDMDMPNGNGWDVLRFMAANEIHVPVVILTNTARIVDIPGTDVRVVLQKADTSLADLSTYIEKNI